MLSLIFSTWVLEWVGATLAVPLTLAETNLVTQYAPEPGRPRPQPKKTKAARRLYKGRRNLDALSLSRLASIPACNYGL